MPAQAPIQSSTQEHLDIEDVRDDIVLLKDGSCCLILTTTAVNFGLLSEPEQDATIYAYAGFLNSLTFSIQILVRSQHKDISSYLQLLQKAENIQEKPLLKEQIQKYRVFVEKIVKENQVLDKKFYVVIPFTAIELGVGSSLTQQVKTKRSLPFPADYILEKAKMSLYPKRDHLIAQFSRLGLKARQLSSQDLLELFYQIYNPESTGQKFSSVPSYSYPIVAPAVTSHTPSAPAVQPVLSVAPLGSFTPAPPANAAPGVPSIIPFMSTKQGNKTVASYQPTKQDK